MASKRIRWFVGAALATCATSFYLAISGSPATPWVATYYANPYLLDPPTLRVNEAALQHNWGVDSPLPGLPPDRFSARWESTLKINQDSDVTFSLRVGDGGRVYVDGVLIIDSWKLQDWQTYVKTVNLKTGGHQVMVEYFDLFNTAEIELSVSSSPGMSFFEASAPYLD